MAVNQYYFFNLFLIIFQTCTLMGSINPIIRTKSPIDMKQMALERNIHRLSLYASKKLIAINVQFSPENARTPHNYQILILFQKWLIYGTPWVKIY